MLKIGLDAKRVFNNYTGLGNYCRYIITELIKQYPENEYHLYTPKTQKNNETKLLLNSSSIHIHTPKTLFPSLWRTWGIPKECYKDQIDIYHGLSHEIPFNLKKQGTPTITTFHDLIYLTHPELFPFFDRHSYRVKYQYAARHSDHIIALSCSTKKDLQHFYNIPEEKISVIYQNCHERFYQTITDEQKQHVRKKYNLPKEFFMYLGSIIPRKRLLNIIKAMKNIPSEKRLPLMAIGRGKDYLEEVKQEIEKNNLNNYVQILSNVPNEELPCFYNLAQFFCYPSIYEGFGIPLIEAMTQGTPVITSNVSSLPEAAGKGGILTTPDKQDELQDAIEKLTENIQLCDELSKKGKEHIKKFHPKHTTKQLIDIYTNTISGTGIN